MVDFLTHYHRVDKPPFQSMSYLPDEEAARVRAALLEENPKAFDFFAEAQVWNMRPLEKYMAREQTIEP